MKKDQEISKKSLEQVHFKEIFNKFSSFPENFRKIALINNEGNRDTESKIRGVLRESKSVIQ